MSARRIAMVLGMLIYIFLWIIALNGASTFIAPLVIPLVLAVLVAGGVALDRFIGVTPRRPHFDDGDETNEQ